MEANDVTSLKVTYDRQRTLLEPYISVSSA